MEEMVIHVNEHNQPMGIVKRSEMRANNYWHRATAVLVMNPAGQVYVHLRSKDKDVFSDHYDMFFGGVLAQGEAYFDNAARELKEEAGIDVDELESLGEYKFSNKDTKVFTHVYKCVHEGQLTLQEEEIEKGNWKNVDNVLEMIEQYPFCKDSVLIFKDLVEKKLI